MGGFYKHGGIRNNFLLIIKMRELIMHIDYYL
jgi:hypothetical protein